MFADRCRCSTSSSRVAATAPSRTAHSAWRSQKHVGWRCTCTAGPAAAWRGVCCMRPRCAPASRCLPSTARASAAPATTAGAPRERDESATKPCASIDCHGWRRCQHRNAMAGAAASIDCRRWHSLLVQGRELQRVLLRHPAAAGPAGPWSRSRGGLLRRRALRVRLRRHDARALLRPGAPGRWEPGRARLPPACWLAAPMGLVAAAGQLMRPAPPPCRHDAPGGPGLRRAAAGPAVVLPAGLPPGCPPPAPHAPAARSRQGPAAAAAQRRALGPARAAAGDVRWRRLGLRHGARRAPAGTAGRCRRRGPLPSPCAFCRRRPTLAELRCARPAPPAPAPQVDKLAVVRSAELGQLLLPLAQGCLRQGPDGLLSDLLLTSRPWGFELGRVRAPTLLVRGCQDGCVTGRMVSASAAAALRPRPQLGSAGRWAAARYRWPAAWALPPWSATGRRASADGCGGAGCRLLSRLRAAACCCVQVTWLQQRISGCRTLLVGGEGHLGLLLLADQIFAAAIQLLEDRGG
jgi:hypothetical protein